MVWKLEHNPHIVPGYTSTLLHYLYTLQVFLCLSPPVSLSLSLALRPDVAALILRRQAELLPRVGIKLTDEVLRVVPAHLLHWPFVALET